ncbi:MAG: 23S rRNA (pseudouridine(1915)-N(3))-methyltransferase RlmH [Betaproteobacteria bacterium]|nr:23S rRNA (pseudouridine(1915)-N(3))-methyltransferase RlmH [Betaproteobacteria bacterium]MDE2423084.1 23S rRNA (pseudouridine(1915)-N(3))-methyltransferase RlmH [Betaproteobacteria bacterium]
MKIRILTLGHKMPHWIHDVQEEYLNRLPKEFSVELIEIKPEARAQNKTTEYILESEAKKIISLLKKDNLTVVLDERGRSLNTLQLTQYIKAEEELGRNIDFIIGSADGLHDSVKQLAQLMINISPFTLPHGMVRAILCEQLYRCYTILQGHPYHRE